MLLPSSLLQRIADNGVPASVPATEAKHVRFCNLAALSGGLCAAVFWLVEIPFINGADPLGSRELVLILLRAAGVVLFSVPLVLNHQRHHSAARLALVMASLLFILSSSLLFGSASPSHLFVLVVAVAAPALFPSGEQARMHASISLCLLTFGLMLWLRHLDRPFSPITRPEIRLAMEWLISFGALLLAISITHALRATVHRAEQHAQREQERADRLLLNILPERISSRLKDSPGTIADGFHDVTVLFADLVGFTPLSEKMTPTDTLHLMDDVFSRFDALVDRFGLEKIKTIGDAYMLAGGLPETSETHAEDVAHMALAMLQEMQHVKGPEGHQLGLRIGIATGPVVAGVIGRKKFLYDLWGDTVNMASRMESSGEPGCIQINETAWQRLKHTFLLRERGEIEVKGKGRIRTWFLIGHASHAD